MRIDRIAQERRTHFSAFETSIPPVQYVDPIEVYSEDFASLPSVERIGLRTPSEYATLNETYVLRVENELGISIVRRIHRRYLRPVSFELEEPVEEQFTGDSRRFYSYDLHPDVAISVDAYYVRWTASRFFHPSTSDLVSANHSGVFLRDLPDRADFLEVRANSIGGCETTLVDRTTNILRAPEPTPPPPPPPAPPSPDPADLIPVVQNLLPRSVRPGVQNIGDRPYPLVSIPGVQPLISVQQGLGRADTRIDLAIEPRTTHYGYNINLTPQVAFDVRIYTRRGISEPPGNNAIRYIWNLGTSSWRRN